MDYEDLRILHESRKTLLKILAGRGYNTKPYEKFGPVEIHAMVSAGDGALRMDMERAPKEGIDYGGITKCTVTYVLGRVKNRLSSYVEALVNPDSEARVDPATTEVVVVSLGDQIVEAFHTAALQAYATRNLRIGFFQAAQLVNNPLEHVDVPRHEKMEESEHEAFLKEHRIKSKANLPPIKFHQDMIARILGLVPGDIVRIHRPSPTAGEGLYYRICKP